jgi:hypothetical protein
MEEIVAYAQAVNQDMYGTAGGTIGITNLQMCLGLQHLTAGKKPVDKENRRVL